MKKILFFFFTVYCTVGGYSQINTLILFTQPSCNNCKYTKHNLDKNAIPFQEFSLEDKDNAVLMLKKLKETGYDGKIFLPVIIANDSILLYPQAGRNDSTLFFVVQNIVVDKKLYTEKSPAQQEESILPEIDDAGCDFDTTIQYLVCSNFKNEADAVKFKNSLIADGYSHADFIFYNRMYRVYAMQIFEDENEVYLLEQIRKKFRGAYLLKIE